MMYSTKKGAAKGLLLLIVAIVVAIGAVMFGRGGGDVDTVAKVATEQGGKMLAEGKDKVVAKGTELVNEHGSDVMEASKKVIDEGKEKMMEKSKEMADGAVEKVVAEGKVKVGETVKEAGEKMMAEGNGVGVYADYVDYTAEKIAAADGAILDFSAPWCPSCQTLEKDIVANLGDIPAGVTILKVDFDSQTELKKKYGVTLQHTLVEVDAAGNEIQQWRGGNTLASIIAKIEG